MLTRGVASALVLCRAAVARPTALNRPGRGSARQRKNAMQECHGRDGLGYKAARRRRQIQPTQWHHHRHDHHHHHHHDHHDRATSSSIFCASVGIHADLAGMIGDRPRALRHIEQHQKGETQAWGRGLGYGGTTDTTDLGAPTTTTHALAATTTAPTVSHLVLVSW